jgi:hypothetical protein
MDKTRKANRDDHSIVRTTNQPDELQPLRAEGFLTGRQKSGTVRTSPKPLRVVGSFAAKTLAKERDED